MAVGKPGDQKQPPPLARPKQRSLAGARGEDVKARPASGKPQVLNPCSVDGTAGGKTSAPDLHRTTSNSELRMELCETEVALMAVKLWAPQRTPRNTGAPISSPRSGTTSARSGGPSEVASARSPRSSLVTSARSFVSMRDLERQAQAGRTMLELEIAALKGLIAEVSLRAPTSDAPTRCTSSASTTPGSHRRPSLTSEEASGVTQILEDAGSKLARELQNMAGKCDMAMRHTENLSASIQDLSHQYASVTQRSGRATICGSPRSSPHQQRKGSSDAAAPSASPRASPRTSTSPRASPRQASLSPWKHRSMQASHTEPVLEVKSPRARGNQEVSTCQRAAQLHRMMHRRNEDNRLLCKEARTLGTRVMRFLADSSLDLKVPKKGGQDHKDHSVSPVHFRPSPPQPRHLNPVDVDDLRLNLQQDGITELGPSQAVDCQDLPASQSGSGPAPTAPANSNEDVESQPATPKNTAWRVDSYDHFCGNSLFSVSEFVSPIESPLEECRLDSPIGSPNRGSTQRHGQVINTWRSQHVPLPLQPFIK